MTPDRGQLSNFVRALFPYASRGSYVSLRAFLDDRDGAFAYERWSSVLIDGSLDPVVDAAWELARLCAEATERACFAPPICTFTNPAKANVKSLTDGLVITAELDSNPMGAKQRLEAVLGPATITMESGGQWVDRETGEVHAKLHLHWRLAVPTKTQIEHDFLSESNRLVVLLVGGDPSAIPAVHPLRWAGSVHRKGEPRLSRIVEYNAETEISLADALDKLRRAVEQSEGPHGNHQQRARGNRGDPLDGFDPAGAPQADMLDVGTALAVIPNDDVHWDNWNRVGLATWAASGGSASGFAAFSAWSQKSRKFDARETQRRWDHYTTSPPDRIGAGSLFHLACRARPDFVKPSDYVRRLGPGEPPAYLDEPPPAGPPQVDGDADDHHTGGWDGSSTEESTNPSVNAKGEHRGVDPSESVGNGHDRASQALHHWGASSIPSFRDPWAEPPAPEWPPSVLPTAVGGGIAAGEDHGLGPSDNSADPSDLQQPADFEPARGDVSEFGGDDEDSVSLAELSEEDIERYRAAIKQMATDKLAELNGIYQVVNEAGKIIVMKWRRDPTLGRDVLDRVTFADFKRMYLNRSIKFLVEKKTPKGTEISIESRNLAAWWLSHPARRQYIGGVTCDPTGRAPADYLNLWRGFAVTPAPGDWGLLRDHIFRIICRGEAAHAEYVLDWLARLVQHPEVPGEIALVLRGKKGAGKSILGVWAVRALAHHGLQITHAEHLVGKFNAHLRDLVVLFADEAFYAGNKQHESVLKGLITEPTVVIEGKNQNIIVTPNMLHVILASNSDWVIPASNDERRFAVFDVLDTRIGDRAYFAAIDQQMRQGGLAAMLHELQHRGITGFEVRDVPQTEALRAQKTLSMSSIERWWLAVLTRGYLWRSKHGTPWFRGWHDFYTTELLVNSYLQWCNENRPFDRKTREQVGAFLAELHAPKRPRGEHPVHETDSLSQGHLDDVTIVRKDRPHGYQVGELVEARVRFVEIHEVDTPWGLDPDE